jgi:hypothetical protein
VLLFPTLFLPFHNYLEDVNGYELVRLSMQFQTFPKPFVRISVSMRSGEVVADALNTKEATLNLQRFISAIDIFIAGILSCFICTNERVSRRKVYDNSRINAA